MSFVESLVAGFRLERALYDTRDPSRCAATIDAYRRNGVAVVPTLVIARNPNYPELVLSDTAARYLTIDGADEVEVGTLHLVKGLGGALLREKIVATATARLVIEMG